MSDIILASEDISLINVDDAISITSAEDQWAKGSETIAPSSEEYTSTMPDLGSNEYLWHRLKLTYSDNTIGYSNGVLSKTINDLVIFRNTVGSTDTNGNYTLINGGAIKTGTLTADAVNTAIANIKELKVSKWEIKTSDDYNLSSDYIQNQTDLENIKYKTYIGGVFKNSGEVSGISGSCTFSVQRQKKEWTNTYPNAFQSLFNVNAIGETSVNGLTIAIPATDGGPGTIEKGQFTKRGTVKCKHISTNSINPKIFKVASVSVNFLKGAAGIYNTTSSAIKSNLRSGGWKPIGIVGVRHDSKIKIQISNFYYIYSKNKHLIYLTTYHSAPIKNPYKVNVDVLFIKAS